MRTGARCSGDTWNEYPAERQTTGSDKKCPKKNEAKYVIPCSNARTVQKCSRQVTANETVLLVGVENGGYEDRRACVNRTISVEYKKKAGVTYDHPETENCTDDR